MQKFVSKYATAAHLALLAVAPLFLFPFFPAEKIAVVTLWLSAITAVWIVMEPSRRRREMPHDARIRVARTILKDPFFWFSVFVSLFGAVRFLNDGISLAYDAEMTQWTLRPARLPILPGSVAGFGFPLFAACVAGTVLLAGVRHALGRKARLAFFVSLTVLAGMASTVSAFALLYGNAMIIEYARCGYLSPSYAGLAYGLLLLSGVVAIFGCAEMKWRQAEPLTGLGAICTSVGFLIFASPAVIAVISALFVLLIVLSFSLRGRLMEGSGAFRCALGIFCVFLAAGAFLFLAAPDSPVGGKRLAFMALRFFPEDFTTVRETLSRIAFEVWKEGPWLGSGLGSFPFDIRFKATSADWAVLDPTQRFVPNGWWLLIAERGVIGASLFVVAFGFLLWTYCSRMIRVIRDFRWQPMNCLFPLILAGGVAVTFVECSFMRADTTPLLLALSAISASAFPPRRERETEK